MDSESSVGWGAESIRNLLLPGVFGLNLLSLIGYYGHISLILSTFKYSFLQNPCNYLIALLALGDFGHQLAHPLYATTVLSGHIFISQQTCYWLQFIPAIFMLYSIFMILNLFLDRLFCVFAPLSYMWTSTSKACYILIHNILAIVYAILIVYIAYQEMIQDPQKETLCVIVGFFAGKSQDIWALTSLIISGISVVIYSLIWLNVKKTTSFGACLFRQQTSGISAAAKNMLKPLTIVILLYFFGWFIGMIAVTVIQKQNLPANVVVGLSSYVGIIINATISANYFVYKYFGSDYRRAFKYLWKKGTTISDSTYSNTRGLSK